MRHGFTPGRNAPPGYVVDMPAFADVLSEEEIRAVLAFIKRSCPQSVRAQQAKVLREFAARP